MNIERNDRVAQYLSHLELRVTESGFGELGSEWKCSRVCSPYSRLYFIYAGEGFVSYGSVRLPLRPGHAYLIPAGLAFDYECRSYLHQLYFHIGMSCADGTDLLSRIHACMEIPMSPEAMKELLGHYRGGRIFDALLLKQDICAALCAFVERSGLGEEETENHSAFLRQLYPLAQQSIGSGVSRQMLAERMSMSESALSKRFKAETGITLGRYMDDLLFRKAQQLLLSSDETIGRIADRLGFCDQFYFTRFFKQRQRETPSQYRRRLRVWI